MLFARWPNPSLTIKYSISTTTYRLKKRYQLGHRKSSIPRQFIGRWYIEGWQIINKAVMFRHATNQYDRAYSIIRPVTHCLNLCFPTSNPINLLPEHYHQCSLAKFEHCVAMPLEIVRNVKQLSCQDSSFGVSRSKAAIWAQSTGLLAIVSAPVNSLSENILKDAQACL